MRHAVLLGDSIFDNAAYVEGDASVIRHVRDCLPPEWRATLLAVDGSIADDVESQLQSLPADATHLIISCGGNDALGQFGVLTEPVPSIHAALRRMDRVRADFEASYRRMLLNAKATQKPLAVCTIYDAIPTFDRAALVAIGFFNDVIIREAALARVPVLDLRAVCTQPSDYSRRSPIEPSAEGGKKIASAIASLLMSHDYARPHCAIHVDQAGLRETR